VVRHVEAKNYFCFFALLEMILADMNISNIDQSEIADYFEIIFPEGYEQSTKKCRYDNDPWKLGAQINTNEVNNFFAENKVQCVCTYTPVNQVCELTFDQVLKGFLNSDDYIITTFSYGVLYDEIKNNEIGHVGLILELLPSYNVQMYDPGPRGCGFKAIDSYALYRAMRYKQGGFYLFKRIDAI